jgi:predicted nucleotidyltransferase
MGLIGPKMGLIMSLVDFMFSERQQKLLAALLLHPDDQFTTNDLIRLSGPGRGASQRILDALVSSGVVTRSSRGNQVLYAANQKNPIYPELRNICFKTFGIGEVVRRHLVRLSSGIKSAFIFGSFAKGEARAESDIDLMVIGDVDFFELAAAVERIEGDISRAIDLNHHTWSEWTSLAGDRVVRSIIDGPKIKVLGDDVETSGKTNPSNS